MFADRDRVRARRRKRRLKAAASILVAVAAGTFLACQRGVETARLLIDASREAGDDARTSEGADGARDADGAPLAVADARPDALARSTASPRDATVDVNEHRKGMPVPDNLLE
jgi:hypothetical protein